MTPEVHAKMMRLLTGQRSALQAVDLDAQSFEAQEGIESAIESTEDQIAALRDSNGE